jgi:hypothetical protein
VTAERRNSWANGVATSDDTAAIPGGQSAPESVLAESASQRIAQLAPSPWHISLA